MFLVMNIGCIECGVSSAIVALVYNEREANEIADVCREHHYFRQGGQNSYEVFPLPRAYFVDKRYLNPDQEFKHGWEKEDDE